MPSHPQNLDSAIRLAKWLMWAAAALWAIGLVMIVLGFIGKALAKDSVLSCFVPDTREHVVIMGSSGDVRLQWNGGKFEYGTAEMMDNRYLLVQQFSSGGTFRMVYDSQSGMAYGGTVFYSGKENKSPFNCVWQ